MATEMLSGSSLLQNENTGVVLRGEIRLWSDGKGRSEIHVANDVTGIAEHLVFQSGQTWIPVLQLIQAIQDTHIEVDLGVPVIIDGNNGVCASCDGLGECTDEDGNWVTCGQCGGRV